MGGGGGAGKTVFGSSCCSGIRFMSGSRAGIDGAIVACDARASSADIFTAVGVTAAGATVAGETCGDSATLRCFRPSSCQLSWITLSLSSAISL